MSDTTANNKRIAKNTLLLYFRMFFVMAVSLYISRRVLDMLGVDDFGIYNAVGGFVAMFTVISGAMTTAIQRFISYEIGKGEKGDIKSIFSTAVIIHVIIAIIIVLFAETFGLWFLNYQMNFPTDRYVAANWVFQFSVLTFITNVISVPYNAAIIAYERMKAFAYVGIIEVSLKLIIAYLLVVSPIDRLVFYSLMLALLAIAIRILYGIYCFKNLKECRCNWTYNKVEGIRIFSFVSWNLIGSTAGVAKEHGINVILNIFFGAAVNSARGIAQQVLNALCGFVSNFQTAMNPQIVKYYAAKENDNMFKLVFRGSKVSYLLLFTLALPVFIETPFFLGVWLKEVPEYTAIFIRLALITALIDSLSGTLIASMHASGKVRDYQIVVGGLSLITLPVVYILLKLGYGPCWAMIIGSIISILCLFARLALLRHTIKLPFSDYLKTVLFRIIPVTVFAPVIPILMYVKMPVAWLSVLIIFFVSMLCSVICIYYIGFTKSEREFIIKKLPFKN